MPPTGIWPTLSLGTELGKALDPLADKLLLVTAYITLAWLGMIPLWLAVLVVLRDVVITSGAIVYRVLYGPIAGAAPTLISKLNTLLQILYVFAVVWSAAMGWSMQAAVHAVAWLVAITTLSSGMDYVITYSRRAVVASKNRHQQAMKVAPPQHRYLCGCAPVPCLPLSRRTQLGCRCHSQRAVCRRQSRSVCLWRVRGGQDAFVAGAMCPRRRAAACGCVFAHA
jgi:hypothetical protein